MSSQELTTESDRRAPESDESIGANNKDTNKGDPGASRHGNFINYYQFHSAEERVRQLPLAVCHPANGSRKYVALDVGCNAGNLTLELHKYLVEKLPGREVSILGIDIDPILIERAREQNDRPESVTFECLDFLSDKRESLIKSYLDKHEVTLFDTSFCFSITMWVHLNTGDAGLVEFLHNVCACSQTVLVEPQPWKCYRNASRRLRRADQSDFPLLKELKYRGDVEDHVQRIIEECGFHKVEVSEQNDWQRRLMYYARNS